MTVSIITITYNAEKFLKQTICSILEQNCSDYEYLIIDGKSTDSTLSIIKSFEDKIKQGLYALPSEQFHWLSEPDKGLYDAMNKGLNLATGDFVWFINAGDKIYSKTTLQKIVETAHLHPNGDIIYGQSLIVNQEDIPLGERHRIAPSKLSKKDFLKGLVVCHQSLLVRKSIAPQYDLHYKLAADYDWACKSIALSRKNCYIDDYLSKFMSSGLSTNHRKQGLFERWQIMCKHFGCWKTFWAHLIIAIRYPFITHKHVYN